MIEVRPQRSTAMRNRIASVLGLAAALLCTTLLLGGCGSSSPSVASDAVARAAYVSSQEVGMRFTLDLRLSYASLSQNFTITGSGYAGQGGHSSKLAMNFSGIPGVTGMPTGGRGVEAVFLYPTVYMRVPFLSDKLPEGKSWLKIDMAKVAQATHGTAVPQALDIGQVDPSQLLQYLKASAGHIQKLGTEQLYGVSTTHYQATLQLAAVLKQLPAQQRIAARPLLQHIGNAGAIPIDVWVDGKGRVRRLQMSLNVAGPTASGSATVTVGFTEYGPVPAVTPPPEGEVVNLTSLLTNGLAGAFSG
ncbi:MAG: hypothetical protein WB698_06180 [Solirubrobacteraceae bacterium]